MPQIIAHEIVGKLAGATKYILGSDDVWIEMSIVERSPENFPDFPSFPVVREKDGYLHVCKILCDENMLDMQKVNYEIYKDDGSFLKPLVLERDNNVIHIVCFLKEDQTIQQYLLNLFLR